MRWDENYKNPEVINDPVVIPAYGVTDEERAYWNNKQNALEYDAEPTPYSDKHMISGAIFNALQEYKLSTVRVCQDFFWANVNGLLEIKGACEAAQTAAEDARTFAETAAQISDTNKTAAENSAINASTYSTAAQHSSENSENSAQRSANSANISNAYSVDSEAYAVGTRNGDPVEEGDPAYHHNAKYFADLGREVIDDSLTSEYYTWSSSKLTTLYSGKADLVDGKVPASQLPSYVDDVLEYNSISEFPSTGESGKIYIAKDVGKEYRWSGSGYAIISESIALGETSSTAYAGNKGKANADAITEINNKIPSATSGSNQLVNNSEMTAALATKSDSTHNHDDRYYTETEINNMFAGVTFTQDTTTGDIYINW